ncbi:MAG TPA: hypothetical protein VEM94_02435 [Candidatus Dormibacteraeota bacterium]|nr:hypothetical protein [Candidatus Dormibacteraeota bacterium]
MRWTWVFAYLSAAVVATLLLSRWVGWTGWLLVISIVLALPVVVGLASSWGHPFRWSSFLAVISAIALLGSLVSEYAGWIEGRNSLLLVWTVLLLAVSITLFSHPMRGPAWGLFVGFWGTVAVIWLIVLQALAVMGFLHGSAYSGWVAWPLAIIGVWILVASATGFGESPFGRVVDVLGLLTGAGLVSISIATWSGADDLTKTIAAGTAVAYCLWAASLGWALWRHRRPGQALRGMTSAYPG